MKTKNTIYKIHDDDKEINNTFVNIGEQILFVN